MNLLRIRHSAALIYKGVPRHTITYSLKVFPIFTLATWKAKIIKQSEEMTEAKNTRMMDTEPGGENTQ
jgi:hypothetical protein